MNLDYLWWTGKLDSALAEDRHQAEPDRTVAVALTGFGVALGLATVALVLSNP